MAYVAVDEDGHEVKFTHCPVRIGIEWFYNEDFEEDLAEELPKGSIKKLIDRELAWADEPVEIE